MRMSRLFKWPCGLTLSIEGVRASKTLEREIGAYRLAPNNTVKADAEIVYCRNCREFPEQGILWQGSYKGLPWKICSWTPQGTASPRYYFYAPFFGTFLFIRDCLLPILKKSAIERGGVLLIGSAFRQEDKVTILFGEPGSRKTRVLLEAVDLGASPIGDSELVLTAQKTVMPVFPYLEARKQTVHRTSTWGALGFQKKIYLEFCQILSRASFGKISFNLLLSPVDLGRGADFERMTVPQRLVFIYLHKKGPGSAPLSENAFLSAIEDYEKHYQKAYGIGIYTPEILSRGLKQMKTILSGASLWEAPSHTAVTDLMKMD